MRMGVGQHAQRGAWRSGAVGRRQAACRSSSSSSGRGSSRGFLRRVVRRGERSSCAEREQPTDDREAPAALEQRAKTLSSVTASTVGVLVWTAGALGMLGDPRCRRPGARNRHRVRRCRARLWRSADREGLPRRVPDARREPVRRRRHDDGSTSRGCRRASLDPDHRPPRRAGNVVAHRERRHPRARQQVVRVLDRGARRRGDVDA